jgi:hypothetical protein
VPFGTKSVTIAALGCLSILSDYSSLPKLFPQEKVPAFQPGPNQIRKPDAGRLGPVACACHPALLWGYAKGLSLKDPVALSVAAVPIVVPIGRVADPDSFSYRLSFYCSLSRPVSRRDC